LEAGNIAVREQLPASRKLAESDARLLLKSASRLIIAKGKKLSEYAVTTRISEEAVAAMLGPTGNLRAPTLRAGKTLVVGFSDEAYQGVFG
jgi:hypothetical protein